MKSVFIIGALSFVALTANAKTEVLNCNVGRYVAGPNSEMTNKTEVVEVTIESVTADEFLAGKRDKPAQIWNTKNYRIDVSRDPYGNLGLQVLGAAFQLGTVGSTEGVRFHYRTPQDLSKYISASCWVKGPQ